MTATWYVLQIAALLLVAISFFKVAQHFNDPIVVTLSPSETVPASPENDAFLAYSKAMNEAQEKLAEALAGNPAGIDQAIVALDSAPQLDAKAEELRQQLKALLLGVKIRDQTTAAPSKTKKGEEAKSGTLSEDVIRWKIEYNQWLKNTGKNY